MVRTSEASVVMLNTYDWSRMGWQYRYCWCGLGVCHLLVGLRILSRIDLRFGEGVQDLEFRFGQVIDQGLFESYFFYGRMSVLSARFAWAESLMYLMWSLSLVFLNYFLSFELIWRGGNYRIWFGSFLYRAPWWRCFIMRLLGAFIRRGFLNEHFSVNCTWHSLLRLLFLCGSLRFCRDLWAHGCLKFLLRLYSLVIRSLELRPTSRSLFLYLIGWSSNSSTTLSSVFVLGIFFVISGTGILLCMICGSPLLIRGLPWLSVGGVIVPVIFSFLIVLFLLIIVWVILKVSLILLLVILLLSGGGALGLPTLLGRPLIVFVVLAIAILVLILVASFLLVVSISLVVRSWLISIILLSLVWILGVAFRVALIARLTLWHILFCLVVCLLLTISLLLVWFFSSSLVNGHFIVLITSSFTFIVMISLDLSLVLSKCSITISVISVIRVLLLTAAWVLVPSCGCCRCLIVRGWLPLLLVSWVRGFLGSSSGAWGSSTVLVIVTVIAWTLIASWLSSCATSVLLVLTSALICTVVHCYCDFDLKVVFFCGATPASIIYFSAKRWLS